MNFLLGTTGPVRPNLPPHLMDEGERGAALVEKATSEILLSPDWSIMMEVVDALNRASDQEIKREIVRQIRKRLQHRSTRVVHMALELIETVVKNCGSSVHKEVATGKFMATMARVARSFSERTGKENLEVADKAMDLIQSWGEAFLPMANKVPLFSQTYHDLRREGLPFRTQYDETKVPVLTPPPSAPSQRGSGQFSFDEGGDASGSVGGSEDVLKMAETSETMLQDILYSIESSRELGNENEVLHAVLGQCVKLSKALQEAIESKVVAGAEDVEEYFEVNDQLQAALHLYEGMKDRSVALPLPQEGRKRPTSQPQPEPELISFDDDEDFVGAGGDSKLPAVEATAVVEAPKPPTPKPEAEVPRLAPSRRDSFDRSGRRGSRGSAGRGGGDLLDLSNLDLNRSSSAASDAFASSAGVGGVGGGALSSSVSGKTLPTVSSITDAPEFATTAAPADPFASAPPVPILPPPRAVGSPPMSQLGSLGTSVATASSTTGLTPQPPQAFFSLPPQPGQNNRINVGGSYMSSSSMGGGGMGGGGGDGSLNLSQSGGGGMYGQGFMGGQQPPPQQPQQQWGAMPPPPQQQSQWGMPQAPPAPPQQAAGTNSQNPFDAFM